MKKSMILSIFNHKRTKSEPTMDPKCTKKGPKKDQKGPKKDQKRTKNGLKPDQKRTKNSILRNWNHPSGPKRTQNRPKTN